MSEPSGILQDLLLRKLREAVSAKLESGADPDEVTADLNRRLHRLRQMRRDERLREG
jgi:hypothetical protein